MKKQDTSLTAAQIRRIGESLAESISTAKNSGSALELFCDTANKHGLSEEPSASDCSAIVEVVAGKLDWKGATREAQNKSEARNIVRQHVHIPELQTALRASEYGLCSYHDAVKLCRLMKKHKTVRATVQAFNTKSAAKALSSSGKFAKALKSFYKAVEGSRSKDKPAQMSALRKCANVFGFEIVA